MLTIHVPPGREAERRWVAAVVFGEHLGIDWQLVSEDRSDVVITMAGSRAEVHLPDIFLATPQETWLTAASVPALPSRELAFGARVMTIVGERTIPAIFFDGCADESACVRREDGHVDLSVDVFGTVFFFLTRYEEVVSPAHSLDKHGRFPAAASVAGRIGGLHRPLADECVELLWDALLLAWPRLSRRPGASRILISCDVDRPFDDRLRSWPTLLRDVVANLVSGNSSAAFQRLRERGSYMRYGDRADPNFSFDAYMDLCESQGLAVTFNFLAGGATVFDASYSLEDCRITSLLHRIHERGHSIGLHGSYGSAGDPGMLVAEAGRLREVLSRNGVSAEVIEGRQHYLRWDPAGSWRAAVSAGLERDSTLGFADHSGFRCGTCREYPVFDLGTREVLPLRERPLVAMDVTLLSPLYEGVCEDDLPQKVASLAATCRRFEGDFTLLWHNNDLGRAKTAELFRQVIVAARGGSA